MKSTVTVIDMHLEGAMLPVKGMNTEIISS